MGVKKVTHQGSNGDFRWSTTTTTTTRTDVSGVILLLLIPFLLLVQVHGFVECVVVPTRLSRYSSCASALLAQPVAATNNDGNDDDVLRILDAATAIDPRNGARCQALDGLCVSSNNNNNNPLASMFATSSSSKDDQKALVVVMPQLGDFDSAEYAELLAAVKPSLDKAKCSLRVIGIGSIESAKRFASFSGLPLDVLRVDPDAKLHRDLNLHGGPDWDIPSFVPDSVLQWFSNYVGATTTNKKDRALVARAWLNYMAMCAGIAAPDTLPEIMRGYLGDKSAPERLRANETVRVGDDDFIVITGVTDVKLGPISYQSLWKKEVGYQRPAELATVRLRAMVEVLSNFAEYVPDQKHLHLRGATFLFNNGKDGGKLEYAHRDTGVLAYSQTMPRPLTFLQPIIGENLALNPLGLLDNRK